MPISTEYYDLLEVSVDADDTTIKKAYRKLAVKYHPDKNLDGDPEKTEKFKEINYANRILENPNKRRVYDEYGEMGLKLMEQFGDDDKVLSMPSKRWIKWLLLLGGILTGCFCCCCCCFCFCCNFCCGRCKPKEPDFNEGYGANVKEEDNAIPTVVIEEPGSGDSAQTSSQAAPIPMPPPPYTEPEPSVVNEEEITAIPPSVNPSNIPTKYGSIETEI